MYESHSLLLILCWKKAILSIILSFKVEKKQHICIFNTNVVFLRY